MSRALLLIGSPKPGKSASRTFAEAMGSRLEVRGCETSVARVVPSFRDDARLAELLAEIAAADLVVLSFPVYVDSLPAPLLRLLESWAATIADGSMPPRRRHLTVLTQCGFPESSHCAVAIETCRLFAEKTGVVWAGSLAFGMGGSIEGGSVERSPLSGRLASLDAAANALAAGQPIPEAATAVFARPLAPAWTYPLLGGWGWSRQAKKRGCSEPLTLKRYAS
jgi:multimeric flavodoxin WrbA